MYDRLEKNERIKRSLRKYSYFKQAEKLHSMKLRTRLWRRFLDLQIPLHLWVMQKLWIFLLDQCATGNEYLFLFFFRRNLGPNQVETIQLT